MKKYYKVSFQHSENIYCANIAHAESVEAVEAHYSKYAWYSVSEASECDVASAQRKGMPIVEIETAPEQEPEQEPAAVKKITLYIGLNDKDTKTQIIPTAEAVSIVTGIIYERTSGATIYRARGIYTHDNGEKVTEETLRVELFGEEPENVKAAAQQIKTALNQESIAYQEETVNSYFI